jgi:hypothetical protein
MSRDEDYLRVFRVTKSTFYWLASKLDGHIFVGRDMRRKTVEQQLAMALIYLSGAVSHKTADMMNCGKSTVIRAVHRVALAIFQRVGPEYLCFPSEHERLLGLAYEFEHLAAGKHGSEYGLPMIVGAMDGTHIPIKDYSKQFDDLTFYNRKGYTSINVHAVCDARGRFLDVYTGQPGNRHDSFVLHQSPLFHKLTGSLGGKMWDWRQRPVANRVAIPFSFIGDSAYGCEMHVGLPSSPPPFVAIVRRRCSIRSMHAHAMWLSVPLAG